MFKILSVLILAHLLADFMMKTEWFLGKEKKTAGIVLHGMFHLLCSILFVMCFGMLKQTIVAIGCITFVHLFVEFSKLTYIRFNDRFPNGLKQYIQNRFLKSKTVLLALKQIIHMITIYLSIYFLVNGIDDISHKQYLDQAVSFFFGKENILSNETKIISFLIVIVFSSKVTSDFVSSIIDDLMRSRERSVLKNYSETDSYAQLTTTNKDSGNKAGGDRLFGKAALESASAAESQSQESEGFQRNLLIPPFPSFVTKEKLINKENNVNVEQYLQSELEALLKFTQDKYKDFHIERALEITEKDEETQTEVKNKVSYNTSQFNDSFPLIASYIGIIERFLIIALVVSGAFTGIAFLGALKAIARYKQFDEKSYAEKFLLGTLLSILSGLLCGLLVIRIFE